MLAALRKEAAMLEEGSKVRNMGGPWLAASKKTGLSILQLRGTEFYQQYVCVKDVPKPQKRTPSN